MTIRACAWLVRRMRTAVVVCLFACVCMIVNMPCASAETRLEPNLVGKTIVLDPGHGGPDSGARNDWGDLEKEITLPVAMHLANLLRQSGATVHMTRVTDDDLATEEDRALGRRQNRDLRNRTRFTLGKEPDAFISIHCNAVPSPSWYGAQMFYMTGNEVGEELAKRMQAVFKAMLLPSNREAEDIATLYLLKRIHGAAVLAEIGFLSNPREAAALKTDAYQKTAAFAMYVAIMDHFADVNRISEQSHTDP